MSNASGSKQIIYYNEKTLKPVTYYPSQNEWIGSLSGDLKWRYVDIDVQKSFIIQIAEDKDFKSVISVKEFITSNKYITFSLAGITVDGIYYWRVKVKGTQASQYSEFSNPRKVKIDSSVPSIDSVDIVSIDNNTEFHSNMKLAIGNVEFDDGIFISADEFSKNITIDITYPFDSNLTEDNIEKRASKRTYFIDAYFPEIETTEDLDVYSHPDFYVEKGLFDNDAVSLLQGSSSSKLIFPKISASLYTHDQNVNSSISQRDFPKTERWTLSFPHNKIVILKIFYLKEDIIYNFYKKYIVEQNENTTSFHRKYTWDSLISSASKNTNFTYKEPLLADSLIKIGSNLTPPSTYVVENPTSPTGLPKFCFGLAMDAVKSLELLDSSYYQINSQTKNSISKIGSLNSTTLATDVFVNLNSTCFDNFRVGDVFTFLNSHFSYKNYPLSPIADFETYRNFKNSFPIKSIDGTNKKLTLLGFDDYQKYTHERFPSASTSYFGEINYDSTLDVTSVTSESILFSALTDVSNNSQQFGNHSLTNFFIGIEGDDGAYKEYAIVDNSAGSIVVDGNILSDLDKADGSSVNFYISGDVFSVYNNSLFIGQNNIRIYVKTSNNISGVNGIKVIETIPTTNRYDVDAIDPPSNISYSLVKSPMGEILGPLSIRYNISSVDESGNEGAVSDDITIRLEDAEYYYVALFWDNVDEAQSYRIYGRSNKEDERECLFEIPYNHFGGNTSIGIGSLTSRTDTGGSRLMVSCNDFGDVSLPLTASSSLLPPSGFSGTVSSSQGFLADETTYYYQITSFELGAGLDIMESSASSEIYITAGDVGDYSKIDFSWTEVSGADGYRIYGRSTGNSKTLLATIYGSSIVNYTDPGNGDLLKNKLISSNASFTRASLPSSDSDIKYYEATSHTSDVDRLETEEDIAHIDYSISDTDNEVVDFYIRIISNSGIQSLYNINNLVTSSVCRRLSQYGTIYDAIKPDGILKLFNSDNNDSEESRVVVDYSEFISNLDPLSSIQLSNFKDKFYTNIENAYSGYKTWRIGFYINLKVSELSTDYWKNISSNENGTYGFTADGSDSFFWAKIPVEIDNSKSLDPISESSLRNYLFDILGKKIYITSKEDDSENFTCLNVEYDFSTGKYVILAKMKSTQIESAENYLNSTVYSGIPLIATTSEFNTDDIESFIGLHAYLENNQGLPYRIISYPNVDFKEPDASELNTSAIGEFDRLQFNINDLLLEDSNYVKIYWNGQIYAPMTGDYSFSVGIRGNVSLLVDENVNKYFKYLNVQDSKKTYRQIINKENNTSYKIWTVDLGKSNVNEETGEETVLSTTQDTYVEHIQKDNDPNEKLVSGGSIRLSKGWHKIRLVTTYSVAESQRQTSNNAIVLAYGISVNDNFTDNYPSIDAINESDYSIDISYQNSFEFENNSLIGGVCMLGILDPDDGVLLSGSSVTEITSLQGSLLDGGAISNGGRIERHLIIDDGDADSDFVVSYNNHFDFIQSDVRNPTFSPIREVRNNETTTGWIDGTGKIVTSNEWTTTITSVGGSNCFSGISAGYSIQVNGETRYVVSKTDSNTITVNRYINIYNAGAGYSWKYQSSSDKVLVLLENEVPSFSFGGQPSSEFRLFKWPFIIKGNTGNNIEFNTPLTGEIQSISTDTDNQITTITSEGIGINNFQLDFYGCPIVLDVDGDNEITRQALLLDDNTVQVNGILPDYSEDEDDLDEDTGLYPHETLYLSTTTSQKTFRLGDINDVANVNDILYINYGRTLAPFSSSNLTKNALPVYAKIKDRYKNELLTNLNISLKGSFKGEDRETESVYDNSILEMYSSGNNKGKVRTITVVGEQAFDAQLITSSEAVYVSDIHSPGANFSFWKTITWVTNTLQNSYDVKFEIRTGSTEEECKNATWNLDATGIQNDPYTILSWDYPSSSSPTSLNIVNYTSDGTANTNNELVKRKFLQFRITLNSSISSYTPKVESVTITYSTSNNVMLLSKNFELDSNIVRGLLTANTLEPDGTGIEYGINTGDETDWSEYYKITLDEVFTLPESIQNDQFRLGFILTSSNEDVPKIYSLSFMFETEEGQELINLNL